MKLRVRSGCTGPHRLRIDGCRIAVDSSGGAINYGTSETCAHRVGGWKGLPKSIQYPNSPLGLYLTQRWEIGLAFCEMEHFS